MDHERPVTDEEDTPPETPSSKILDHLQKVNMAVEERRDTTGGFRTTQDASLPPPRLKERLRAVEVLLSVGVGLLMALGVTAFWRGCDLYSEINKQGSDIATLREGTTALKDKADETNERVGKLRDDVRDLTGEVRQTNKALQDHAKQRKHTPQ